MIGVRYLIGVKVGNVRIEGGMGRNLSKEILNVESKEMRVWRVYYTRGCIGLTWWSGVRRDIYNP